MTYRGFDSVTSDSTPIITGAIYAAYVNGIYANVAAVKAHIGSNPMFTISINAIGDADCLDVEQGDAVISDAPAWFNRQKARGVWKPIIYTSAANLVDLVNEMTVNGIPRSDYRIWSAHYESSHVCNPTSCGYPAVDGTQWRVGGPGFPTQYDESTFNDSFVEQIVPIPSPPTPVPVPVPPVLKKEEIEMFFVRSLGNGGSLTHKFNKGAVFVLTGGNRVYVPDQGQLEWYTDQLGHGPVDATPQMIERWRPL